MVMYPGYNHSLSRSKFASWTDTAPRKLYINIVSSKTCKFVVQCLAACVTVTTATTVDVTLTGAYSDTLTSSATEAEPGCVVWYIFYVLCSYVGRIVIYCKWVIEIVIVCTFLLNPTNIPRHEGWFFCFLNTIYNFGASLTFTPDTTLAHADKKSSRLNSK